MDSKLSVPQQQSLARLLRDQGISADEGWQAEWLAGDGSDRLFCRIRRPGGATLLSVVPSPTHDKAMLEARAGFAIGRHLAQQGVSVPACLAFDHDTGIMLCEDLGDRLLHAALEQSSETEKRRYYRDALAALVRLQVEGRKGFDTSWCWDTPRYDRQLMLTREAYYFRDAFCRELLGMASFADALDDEFHTLAARASEEPADFLLHRDFQSRNLMIAHDGIRIIDFQGARLGPLGYDLASLLLDPYAGLDAGWQAELKDYYLDTLSRYITLDPSSFNEGYYYLLLQRNLQILGAFAFLWKNRGKVFFRRFLAPALSSLAAHLARGQGAAFPFLRALVDDSRSRLEQHL